MSRRAEIDALAIVQQLVQEQRVEVWNGYSQKWDKANHVGWYPGARYRVKLPAPEAVYVNVLADGQVHPYITEQAAHACAGEDGITLKYVLAI